MDKAWVQAAVDVEDIELAKTIALMAKEAGAEWIEAGTPLLYANGWNAIAELRKVLGPDVTIIADYKFFDISFIVDYVASRAASKGTDYWLVDGADDNTVKQALAASEKFGIKLVVYIDSRSEDIGGRAKELADLGVKYLFIMRKCGEKRDKDALKLVKEAVPADVAIGVTSDDYDEVTDSVKNGADWIIFGVVLKDADAEVCQKWVDNIHKSR